MDYYLSSSILLSFNASIMTECLEVNSQCSKSPLFSPSLGYLQLICSAKIQDPLLHVLHFAPTAHVLAVLQTHVLESCFKIMRRSHYLLDLILSFVTCHRVLAPSSISTYLSLSIISDFLLDLDFLIGRFPLAFFLRAELEKKPVCPRVMVPLVCCWGRTNLLFSTNKCPPRF